MISALPAGHPAGRPGTHTLLADAVHYYISLLELCRGAARESRALPVHGGGSCADEEFNSHPSVDPLP